MLHTIDHANGVRWTQTFDPSARLTRPHTIATSNVVGTTFTTGEYGYDGAGNIWKTGAQQYQYDGLSRLKRGEVQVGAVERIQTAGFDVYGNLTSLVTDGQSQSLSPSASTNRLTGTGITYDAAGNLTSLRDSGDDFAYVYDPLSMMKTFQSEDLARVYFYDANDERLFAWDCPHDSCGPGSNSERWTIRGLGGEILRVFEGTELATLEWQEDFVYRGTQLLATVRSDGAGGSETQHVHLDHLGSTRQVTDSNRVEVSRHAYYPFGEEATAVASDDIELKFTGHERERNGGGAGVLDYMHARHCSPVLGRFLSFDPIGGNPRSAQTWNRYAYTLGNPLRWTDPRGLTTATFHGEITVTADDPKRQRELVDVDVPAWLFENFYWDVTPHFDGGRFDFKSRSFGAWTAWDNGGVCDAWCSILANVGESATAVTYMEFGLSGVAVGVLTGPFLARAPRYFPGSEPIAKSLGAASRAEMVARRLRLNPNSPTTRQALNHLDMSVIDFVGKFRQGRVLKELGGEVIDSGMTVEQALAHSPKVRKLLIDRRFAKK